MSKVKDVYSRIAPASKSQINVKNSILEKLLKDINQKLENQQKELTKELTKQNRMLIKEQKKQNDLLNNILSVLEKNGEKIKQNYEMTEKNYETLKQICGVTEKNLETAEQNHKALENTYKAVEKNQEILKQIREVQKKQLTMEEKVSKASDEAVWGLTFNNAVNDSEWLINKTFYPGRWAVGYQYLYVLFRVLNEYKPKQILELGLGQSTHMITQYTEKFDVVQHRVVEHDEKWIEFFVKEHELSEKSELVQLNLGKEEFLDDPEVLIYQGFADNLKDRKYDFISVDAPFGGLAKVYARIDILKIIPDCLDESFVIMVDDANREGEQHTIQLIKEKLEENQIEYSVGSYRGNKETYIITSLDNKFLCTL